MSALFDLVSEIISFLLDTPYLLFIIIGVPLFAVRGIRIKLFKKKANKLYDGMSMDEAISIMGNDFQKQTQNANTILTWTMKRLKEPYIAALFDGSTLISLNKSYQKQDYDFTLNEASNYINSNQSKSQTEDQSNDKNLQ